MKKIGTLTLIVAFIIIGCSCFSYYNNNAQSNAALVRFNDVLYRKSVVQVDYVGGDIPIGKIDKLSKENIPQINGETNKEYIVGGIIFNTDNILNDEFSKGQDESIVIETYNSYILFERVKE